MTMLQAGWNGLLPLSHDFNFDFYAAGHGSVTCDTHTLTSLAVCLFVNTPSNVGFEFGQCKVDKAALPLCVKIAFGGFITLTLNGI